MSGVPPTHNMASKTIGKTERFTGRDEDRDVFLMRFECDAQEYGHWPIYKDTTTRPLVDADIHALSDAAAKKVATNYCDDYIRRQTEAYYFVLRALDGANALVVKSETGEGDGRAAYQRMMRILADDSSASTMSLTIQLMQIKGEEGDNPTKILRAQQQLYNKLKAAGFTLDDLMRALALHALPPEFAHLRPKYLDAEDTSGNPLTYATLRARLETQFTAEAVSDQSPAVASAHALRLEQQANDLKQARDELAALQG